MKEMMNKVEALQACESTCHESTSKDEVESYKEDIIFEKEELIMKKGMKKGNNEEKNLNINKKVFHSMKVIYEKAIEVSNDLK